MSGKLNNNINNLDVFFDKAKETFLKIPNFNLVNTDEKSKAYFDFMVSENSTLLDIKILYLEHYIPAAKKHVENSKKQLLNSKYAFFIKDMLHFADESYWETIRLGYVALFHRYESFIHNLLKTNIFVFDLPFKDERKYDNFLKKELNFNLLNNYRNFRYIHQINWVCNSVKHNNGFPKSKNIPTGLEHLPLNEKIKISDEILKKHFDVMFIIYENLIKIISQISGIISVELTDNIKTELKDMLLKFVEILNNKK